MGIEKIDENFNLREKIVANVEKSYTIPSPYFDLYGVHYDAKANGFVRIDLDTAAKISEGVHVLSRYTAGGRLRFRTDSSTLKIAVTYSALGIMSHMPLTGSSGFSLCEQTERGEVRIKQLAPLHTDEKGFTTTTQLPVGGMREYVLYFPLYNEVSSLTVTLDENARVERGNGYRDVLPILYYGSSITQGGCASRPDNSYQALICRRNGIDFINLGFSGNAKAEKEMVAYLGGLDCSLFVCDYDHNAPTAAYLKDTHYILYKQYRALRATTPILFISKPDITGDAEGEERLLAIRSTYLKAKAQGDKNVYFLSGKTFYGKKDRWDFTVDGCHPTDYGFAAMAEKIYKKMCLIDEKFKGESR